MIFFLAGGVLAPLFASTAVLVADDVDLILDLSDLRLVRSMICSLGAVETFLIGLRLYCCLPFTGIVSARLLHL